MRLCLVSDTHRHRHELLTAVKSVQPLDAILHAGDEASDAVWLAERVDWPIYTVAGNWDSQSDGIPAERVLSQFGPRVLLTHGHQYRVKDGLSGIASRAAALGAQIIIFGHTHMALATTHNGRLFINPGSLSTPRGRRERTFAVVDIEAAEANIRYEVRVTHMTAGGESTPSVLHVVLDNSGSGKL